MKEEFVRNGLQVKRVSQRSSKRNVVSGEAPQVGRESEGKELGLDDDDDDEEVMGSFRLHTRIAKGQMVADFAKRIEMAIVNTFFQKRHEKSHEKVRKKY